MLVISMEAFIRAARCQGAGVSTRPTTPAGKRTDVGRPTRVLHFPQRCLHLLNARQTEMTAAAEQRYVSYGPGGSVKRPILNEGDEGEPISQSPDKHV